MARSPSGSGRRDAGATRWGCLVRLVLVAAAAYYGFHLLDPYVRYLRIRDTIKQQAVFAVNLSDAEIRRRIQQDVRKLGLPEEANRVHIQRKPGEKITIWIEYTETLDLPGFKPELHFRPQVERGLWKL